jgi:hypothetical protein
MYLLSAKHTILEDRYIERPYHRFNVDMYLVGLS